MDAKRWFEIAGRSRFGIVGAATLVAVLLGGAGALASGILTVTPSEGPPGTDYEVRVDCGHYPDVILNELYGWHGTLPRAPMTEESPGSWVYRTSAGDFDVLYETGCDGETGSGRFDSDHPRLFPGPIPPHGPLPPDFRPSRVDGTDCPAGTRASVDIQVGDGPDGTVSHTEVDIDEYGDWYEPLPVPLGSQRVVISASCGSVVYDDLVLPADSSIATTAPADPGGSGGTDSGGSGEPESSGSGQVPDAAPATAQAGAPSFTG